MHQVLVIGTGSIGERHVRCLLATGRAEVAICETRHDVRRRVADAYGVTPTASIDEALGRAFDAAVIATPAPSHVPIARRLAESGLHLLIEKPLSTSTDAVADLARAVAAGGLKAAVAYVYRAHPVLAAMRDALRSGRFGRPLQATCLCGQNFPFYRPAYREIYYADRASGGGAIQDALTHIVNAAEWLIGPATRVAADAGHRRLDGVTVEDTVHVLARHGDVMACYALNQYQAPNEITITVVCENGTARFELHECRWRWMTEPGGAWSDEARPPMQRDDWFTRQEHAFLDLLDGKAEPLCTLGEGLQTLKVNLALLESADTGRGWIPIDSDER